jgi:hypothetical protein
LKARRNEVPLVPVALFCSLSILLLLLLLLPQEKRVTGYRMVTAQRVLTSCRSYLLSKLKSDKFLWSTYRQRL